MILRLCELFLLNNESADGGRFKLVGKKPTAFKNYMLQLLLESVLCYYTGTMKQVTLSLIAIAHNMAG
jgi:hypothetical protein